ncbi:MAG: 50S ribosomal protein L18 [Myxococcota bacterium]
MSTHVKLAAQRRRKKRIRKKVVGSAERPRMTVFKSNKHIYVQVIDDDRGATLAAASTQAPDIRSEIAELNKVDAAGKVGELAAKACQEAGISKVVFDRNGYPYRGRVAALAKSARDAGLDF